MNDMCFGEYYSLPILFTIISWGNWHFVVWLSHLDDKKHSQIVWIQYSNKIGHWWFLSRWSYLNIPPRLPSGQNAVDIYQNAVDISIPFYSCSEYKFYLQVTIYQSYMIL